MKSAPMATIKQNKPSTNRERPRVRRTIQEENVSQHVNEDDLIKKFRQNLFGDNEDAGNDVLLLVHEIRNPLDLPALIEGLESDHQELHNRLALALIQNRDIGHVWYRCWSSSDFRVVTYSQRAICLTSRV